MLSLIDRSRRNLIRKTGLSLMLASCALLAVSGPRSIAHAEPPSTLTQTKVYLPLVSRSALPCNDVEDNDVPEQAKSLVPLGQACSGSFEDDPAGEDDYYSITLTEGQILTMELTDIPAEADYDLILYRLGGSEAVATSNQLGEVDERITYTVPTGDSGTYLVRLNMYIKSAAAANSYLLRADIQ